MDLFTSMLKGVFFMVHVILLLHAISYVCECSLLVGFYIYIYINIYTLCVFCRCVVFTFLF